MQNSMMTKNHVSMWLEENTWSTSLGRWGPFWCGTKRKLERSNMITGQRMMVQTVERENGEGDKSVTRVAFPFLPNQVSSTSCFIIYALYSFLFFPSSFMPRRITIDLPHSMSALSFIRCMTTTLRIYAISVLRTRRHHRGERSEP